MKCGECNSTCKHFKSTSTIFDKDERFRVTQLYYKCVNCGVVFVKVLIPQPVSDEDIVVDHVEDYPLCYKLPQHKCSLDDWL